MNKTFLTITLYFLCMNNLYAESTLDIECPEYKLGETWKFQTTVDNAGFSMSNQQVIENNNGKIKIAIDKSFKFKQSLSAGVKEIEYEQHRVDSLIIDSGLVKIISQKQTSQGQTTEINYGLPHIICGKDVPSNYKSENNTTIGSTIYYSATTLVKLSDQGEVSINTPAGTFKTNVFKSTMKVIPQQNEVPIQEIEILFYVAKEIGVVKSIFKSPNSLSETGYTVTEELLIYHSI